MSPDPQEPAPERILLVRPSALGDVCRSVPVLASLKRAYPEAAIDWVVRDTFLPAIASHPDLHEAIPFPRARFGRWWRSPAVASEIRRWGRDLARRRYDVVYDLQGLGRSGLITWMTRAPRRVGYRSARERAWLGYTVRHDPPAAVHIVDQMLELIAREGINPISDMRLYAPPEADASWRSRREAMRIQGAYAVLAPTSRWPSKCWPIEHWSAIITPLLKRGFDRILVIGGPGEEDQVEGLRVPDRADAARVVSLVGIPDIAETLSIIAQAGLVIANDSAPLHMAVGFDRPTLGLFGPTDPSFVGPYGPHARVIQSPSDESDDPAHYRDPSLGDRLMRRIEPVAVLAQIDAIREAADAESRSATPRPESRAGS